MIVRWYTNLSENTRIAFVGVLAVSIVTWIEVGFHSGGGVPEQRPDSASLAAFHDTLSVPLVDPDLDQALHKQTTRSVEEVDPLFGTLMREGAYGALKSRLMTRASAAVSAENSEQLARTLVLLGQVSIEQQNLGAAEVYLFEALDVLDDDADPGSRANIYLQLGRTYLKSRQIARNAGYAYDALQIGRTQLSQKRFDLAEANIRYAIKESLSVHRYNAAASAYESLATMHRSLGDTYLAEEAQLEAARLYSSSGQTNQSTLLVDQLVESGIEPWRLLDISTQIDRNAKAYEDGIMQIGTARDYRRLYNYYLGKGDYQRAWHFRLLASQSLEEVSKRAMFHRQQGVLALLYNSNDAMAKATKYFASASSRFTSHGNNEEADKAAELRRSVY